MKLRSVWGESAKLVSEMSARAPVGVPRRVRPSAPVTDAGFPPLPLPLPLGGLAVGLAVSAYGLSFGALAVASGLDIWQTQVLSLFNDIEQAIGRMCEAC